MTETRSEQQRCPMTPKTKKDIKWWSERGISFGDLVEWAAAHADPYKVKDYFDNKKGTTHEHH